MSTIDVGHVGKEEFVAKPYRHQVGGHGPVVSLHGTSMVAKPIDSKRQECKFYQQAPPELLPFVPTFHGLAKVKFSADAINATSQCVAGAPTDGAGPAELHLEPCAETFSVLEAPEVDSGRGSGDESVGQAQRQASSKDANPWSLAMYRKQLAPSRISKTGVLDCILLENLTGKFKYPCVLDVKIGTRLYDDDADAKKRERCQAKASSTTTEALGVRICGMQVYSTESGKYLCQDKYHGRSLTPRTITEALRKYFELSTGAPPSSCARSRGIINGFLERMQHLTQVVEGQKGMRFYSSSLLLMYDGDLTNDAPRVDIRMIDFAHTTFEQSEGAQSELPDEGYLFGLGNLGDRLRGLMTEGAAPQPPAAASAQPGAVDAN